MTRLSVGAGRATQLESLEVDALVLPMFEARVQPRGIAGHADWRLCGRIARLIREETFRGSTSEALLMPTGGRIRASRVFLFGLGPPGPPVGSDLRARLSEIVGAVVEAGAPRHAVGFPVSPRLGPSQEHADEVEWAWAWIEAAATWRARVDASILLDEDGTLARSAPALRERARDLGLMWEA